MPHYGRYDSYRTFNLSMRVYGEFGSPALRGAMIHQVGDDYVFAYQGHRIAYVDRNDTCYLVVPPMGLTPGVCARWGEIAHSVTFSYERLKRVTGVNQYQLWSSMYDSTHYNARRNVSEAIFTSSVRLELDGTLSLHGIKQKVTITDRPKYNAFNKQLKGLRAVLFAQIKMQAATIIAASLSSRSALQKLIADTVQSSFGIKACDTDTASYLFVNKWMQDQDPIVARQIATLAFAYCRTEANGEIGLMRQVSNVLRRAQQTFLRDHCVTILETIPGPADDQKSELQSPDGLREVQVSGEAQVR